MNAASWMDLLTQQRIGQALAATLSAGLFLYGGLVLLPKAWPRLSRAQRAASGVILSACAVLFALTWIPDVPAHGFFNAITSVTLGLFYFAAMGLEWDIPRLDLRETTPPPASRRTRGWALGSCWMLSGMGQLARNLKHGAPVNWLLLGLAFGLLVLAVAPRSRDKKLPR